MTVSGRSRGHGMDAAAFPLERLIGDCVLLDFRHKKAEMSVRRAGETLEEIRPYEGEIKFGDMLLFNFSCAQFYGDRGFCSMFGEERVRDTPISETGIVGAAVGTAMTGLRPVAEIQFNDFSPAPWTPSATRRRS